MKDNQAGGIVSFVVVGLVLVGLLAGGLYYSKYQGRQARNNETSTPQVTTTTSDKKDEAKPENMAGQTPQPTSPSGSNQTAPKATPQPTPAPAQPTDRVATTGPSEDIPSTGPRETSAVVLVVSLLTFAATAFVHSRRQLRTTSLRR